jgi:hypothetical protein
MAKHKTESNTITDEDNKLPGAEESGKPPRPNQPEGHNTSRSAEDGRDPPKNTDVNKGGVEKASGTATRRGSEGANDDAKTGMVGSSNQHASDTGSGEAAHPNGPQAVPGTPDAYRQQVAMDVFCTLVHGVRIEVKDTEQPSATAERILKLHSELMLKAEQAGIIPPAGEKAEGEQFKQYEGAEALKVKAAS